ncbi:hypothetical protein [Amycolatopsis sp.]|jgi:hypothetical protein|uniref:hypothetical protein n=1 Tax=Amycolatopsis sp. TaxID=37632 RepID=UPI002E09C572|nr:hypothetical protein [Amycolatopsis sp.]
MPIRTNRGRAAVYRRLWGWPLRSPKHLASACIVLAILVIGLGIVLPQTLGKKVAPTPADPFAASPTSSSRATAGIPITSSTTSSPLPTRLSAPLLTPSSAAPNPDGLKVAKQWATAFVTHPDGITNAQWQDGLRPFTTEEGMTETKEVEPGNIPASEVTGEPRALKSFSKSLEAEVSTNGPKLIITVIDTGNGWRVSHYNSAS